LCDKSYESRSPSKLGCLVCAFNIITVSASCLKTIFFDSATTLYDRPAEIFRPISLFEKHELFLKLGKDYHEFSSSRPDDTLLTERFADGQVRLREDRPGLLVSSTSWTEDEDFSVLLDALDGCRLFVLIQITIFN